MSRYLILFLLACVGWEISAWETQAQRYRRGQREIFDSRGDVPQWEIESDQKEDIFTFVRVIYDSWSGRSRGGWGRRGGGCWTDYPDADLNFSYRLQELTSLKVNPNGVQLRLDDPRLFDYPFIYIVEPGALVFSSSERETLRKYLLNGGFLMVDDFWGDAEYENWDEQIRLVLPEEKYRPKDLTLNDEIFNMVFPLGKTLDKLPQIPNIAVGTYSQFDGVTWENNHGPGSRYPTYRAIFDDNGRIMVFIGHNTDLGDGWEREGENEYYFREFSEKQAYPLGINIVFYAMTH